MMKDDVHGELLDDEFRQILYIIKPHINHINDQYHLERFRIWLERLSAARPSEKLERNKYLLELANQIHEDVLQPPFIFNPPKGPLPRLKSLQKPEPQPDPACISEHFLMENLGEVQWPYLSPRRYHNVESNYKPPSPPKEIIPPKKKNSKTKSVRPFQKIGKTVQEPAYKSETSSWCDISETPSTTQASGDRDIDDDTKKRLNVHGSKKEPSLTTQHKEEALKTKEHFTKKYKVENQKTNRSYGSTQSSSKLKEHVNKYEDQNTLSSREGSGFDVRQFVEVEEKNLKPTTEELEALKMRMKDLLEVKNALRDTHCLTEDRKKNIDNLQAKLSQAEKQNSELKLRLDTQQKKFMELEKVKSKELNDFKEKFTHLRQKEVEYLKQFHKDEHTSIEKSHGSKITEMQAQIKALKDEYEEKIKELTDSNMSVITQKESEIQQLQSKLTMQASQLSNQNEGSAEQIFTLKRCISKLDKLLHKNEKEYAKKIETLKRELEMKEMTSQVRIQTQRADLIVQNTAAKQEELKNALNSLEGKYKKMMENLQIHALEAKRHDDQLIDKLKLLLHKHNIPYEHMT